MPFFFLGVCYLSTMPTEKPKIIFVADKELFEKIDDFRFENRVANRSEAIRQLVRKSLDLNELLQKDRNAEILEAVLEGLSSSQIVKDFDIPERRLKYLKKNFIKALKHRKYPS